MQCKLQSNQKYSSSISIKQLAEVFKGQFECLGENTEKYITFSVPIKKDVADGREEEDDSKREEIGNGKEDDSKKEEKEDEGKKEEVANGKNDDEKRI